MEVGQSIPEWRPKCKIHNRQEENKEESKIKAIVFIMSEGEGNDYQSNFL